MLFRLVNDLLTATHSYEYLILYTTSNIIETFMKQVQESAIKRTFGER